MSLSLTCLSASSSVCLERWNTQYLMMKYSRRFLCQNLGYELQEYEDMIGLLEAWMRVSTFRIIFARLSRLDLTV